MALEMQLPCDSAGVCMRCKVKPPSEESLSCNMCATPWHVSCLSSLPESLASTQDWQCPDCSGDVVPVPDSGIAGFQSDGSVLVAAIRAIEADQSLTEQEKAKKRQQLMSGKADDDAEERNGNTGVDDDALAGVGENLKCSICIQLLERPVTTPCGHNFCLKCFKKWIGQGKFTCAKCRSRIPRKMARNPLINCALVSTIRLTTDSKRASVSTARPYNFISNENRPDKAFRSERAVKSGLANASGGKIYVTIPPDHFGPIPAENDPTRNQGVLVGETWPDRLDCRQWGAHFVTIGGIAGQSKHGAQSVALSGGYKDDEDHGEWFLYTGSGGRDLSNNKRTNKDQSFDQTFTKANEALRLSCKMGYPVRVVRSHKEKRSAYAPAEKGLRYDGVYRIEKCWRKVGVQGFKICRYLFVRCDNERAPWTSGGSGDRPRSLPNIPELKKAIDLFVREESPSWDFDEAEGRWKWVKSPPASRKAVNALDPAERKRRRKAGNNTREKLLKELSCRICRKVMSHPVTTPCAHNFCKACLESKFAGITQVRVRSSGGRTLRAQKNVMTCPCCPIDLSEFLQNPQVNRELMDVIEKLKEKEEKPVADDASSSASQEEEEEEEEEAEEEEEEEEEEAEEEEEEEEEETQQVVSETEPPMKKMKLEVDAVAATATE